MSGKFIFILLISFELNFISCFLFDHDDIVFAVDRRLEIINIRSNRTNFLLDLTTNVTSIVAVAYHNNTIFYTDLVKPKTYEIHAVILTALDGAHINTRMEMLALHPDSSIRGLSYDSFSRHLFYADDFRRVVYSLDISSLNDNKPFLAIPYVVLSLPSTYHPQSLIIDALGIYWTSQSKFNSSIEINIFAEDGIKHNKRIASVGMNRVRGIALDNCAVKRHLYWITLEISDSDYFTLERSLVNGSDREALCRIHGQSPYDLTVTANFVIWTDWTQLRVWYIKKPSKPEKCEVHILRKLIYRPMGIASAGICIFQPLPEVEESSADTCNKKCFHGECDVTGKCSCFLGYEGPFCGREMDECFNTTFCASSQFNSEKNSTTAFIFGVILFLSLLSVTVIVLGVSVCKKLPSKRVAHGFANEAFRDNVMTTGSNCETEEVEHDTCIIEQDLEDCCYMTICTEPCPLQRRSVICNSTNFTRGRQRTLPRSDKQLLYTATK